MKKYTVLIFMSLIISLCSCNIDLKSKKVERQKKPNILLFISEQMPSTSMSCAGNEFLKTPTMDKLAATGVQFENNYVTQPLCQPYRTSLQTGRYPHENGVQANGNVKLNDDYPMLGELVASAGYKCDFIAKWHVGCTPEEAGYDSYTEAGSDTANVKKAIEYLNQKHEKPFFLTVSLRAPHDICNFARGERELHDCEIGELPTDLNDLPPLPDNFDFPENEPSVIRKIQRENNVFHYPTDEWGELEWRQYLWAHYRMVEAVDSYYGEVLAALEESSYDENTLIIFTSDHGEGVAMHHWNQKQILYDQSTKTPFIINWKNVTKKSVYSELVSSALDIPATILDIINVEKPASMPGISMLPVLEGDSIEPREYVVSQTIFVRKEKNLGGAGRMIRTKKYKYCIYDRGEKREQLFDMEKDPGEMNNLAFNEGFKDELTNHRNLIAKWAEKYKDVDFPYFNGE